MQKDQKTPTENGGAIYEPPRVVRIAVRTTRDQLQWQYSNSSLGTCTNHNHDSTDPGCQYPQ